MYRYGWLAVGVLLYRCPALGRVAVGWVTVRLSIFAAVWMNGCMGAWLAGCIGVRVYGCMGVKVKFNCMAFLLLPYETLSLKKATFFKAWLAPVLLQALQNGEQLLWTNSAHRQWHRLRCPEAAWCLSDHGSAAAHHWEHCHDCQVVPYIWSLCFFNYYKRSRTSESWHLLWRAKTC